MKTDLYQRITNRIVSDLESGVRSWLRPWNAEHAAGRITRPLRWNGQPYSGINVVTLWMESVAKNYAAPIWMTFNQALELGGCVRKGEHGSLVVYADRIKRKDTTTGEEHERQVPFLKGYTAFNVEQIDGLRRTTTARLRRPSIRCSVSHTPRHSLPRQARRSGRAETAPTTRVVRLHSDAALRGVPRRRKPLRHAGARDDALDSARDAPCPRLWAATRVTRWRSLSPSLARRFCPPISG